jgi:hypothetical protein
MQLEDITVMMFAACNSIRVVAYIPQIYKAATDLNGASAISRTTWTLFLLAHLSTIAYALVNRADYWLAACFALNALCCIAILAIACWRGRHFTRIASVAAQRSEGSNVDFTRGRHTAMARSGARSDEAAKSEITHAT